MTKSFLFVALVLGLFLVQTCSVQAAPENLPSSDKAVSKAQEEEASHSDADEDADLQSDDEYESDDETGSDKDPEPNCLLFGHIGCRVQCTLMYQAYNNQKASGNCDNNQTCQCYPTTSGYSLQNLLETKFHANYVRRQLDDYQTLLKQVLNVFQSAPLRTADQFKQLIKPYLTPYQFSKLETNDETMAAKFIEEHGKINTEAVQKYVADKVGRLVRSSDTKSLLTVPYKDNLKEALEELQDEKGTLYNLTYRVRQLKNKTLKEVLEEYLKNSDLKEPKVDLNDDQDLNTVFANAITNEIIALNDKKAKAQAPKKATPLPKKPAAKSTPKSQRSF